jgi:hypothetical protein
MFIRYVFAVTALSLLESYAQSLKCASVAGGCDEGADHTSVIKDAIARFLPDQVYGGNSDSVFSSALDDTSLAAISFSCQDGSVLPKVAGSFIQSQ